MKNNIVNYHFTVVIPTRERCDTLEHALHTCVIQDYDNLEILVSDNFSQDRTREVVESYKDPRIRYINTGKRVSMTDNFEFALSHVKPEGYIIYIGDDDGLLPNAIRDINTIVNQTGAQVLHWDSPQYRWPSFVLQLANQLHIPSLSSRLRIRNSMKLIKDILSFKAPYVLLPMMYIHSAVSYAVIQKIKDISGRFYHSMIPDIYSGFAIAGCVDKFFDSQRPFSICGVSHNSNGASAAGYTEMDEHRKFLSEITIPFHHELVFSRSVPLYVIESFLQARDHLPFFHNFSFDMRKLLFEMMQKAATNPPDIYQDIKKAVTRLGQRYNLPDAAKRAIMKNPIPKPGSRRELSIRNLLHSLVNMFSNDILNDRILCLDCNPFNINNIYDASILCHYIFKLKDNRLISQSGCLKSSLSYKRKIILNAN